MQTPAEGYTFYDKPVSKEVYRAALYLMYADHLKSSRDFIEIRKSCREAASYISTLDEVEIILGHYREEIFFELERSEGFEEGKTYKIPRSLLEYPVHEERALRRLTYEMGQIWEKLQSAQKLEGASKLGESFATKSAASKSTASTQPASSKSPSRPSALTYGYTEPSHRARAQREFATAMRVAGIMIVGMILMYGCAISLAVPGS